MPKDGPIESFSGGPLLPRWLRALSAWRAVKTAGAYAYQENAVTGARRAIRLFRGGHCPVDTHWVDATKRPSADTLSIFPHFDVRASMPKSRRHVKIVRFVRPGETVVLGPDECAVVKPRVRVPYRKEPGKPAPPPDRFGVLGR